jgi:predicted acyl esterase
LPIERHRSVGCSIERKVYAHSESFVNVPMETVGNSLDVEERRLEIATRDGCLLGATLYMPVRQGDSAYAVVFNAGRGLSAIRYR